MTQIKISRMSGKLKGISGINSNPLTNPYCQASSKKCDLVCSKCYSRKMLQTFRSNAVPAFERNNKLLSSQGLTDDQIPRIKYDVVRFNAHGELINTQHLLNLFRIAKKYPKKQFTLWTKRSKLVQKQLDKKPDNVILIYSNPVLNNIVQAPKGFDKVFNVVEKDRGFDSMVNCGARSCAECMLCYTHNDVSIVVEHLK